jgi:hypothetical protein
VPVITGLPPPTPFREVMYGWVALAGISAPRFFKIIS